MFCEELFKWNIPQFFLDAQQLLVTHWSLWALGRSESHGKVYGWESPETWKAVNYFKSTVSIFCINCCPCAIIRNKRNEIISWSNIIFYRYRECSQWVWEKIVKCYPSKQWKHMQKNIVFLVMKQLGCFMKSKFLKRY